ncbi:pyrroline-5-carboxylate reductase [Dinghuibacter silviterrae]|uniref:Pyrroline-5-carboxylate reductase n=1 Tax=Dinghuibacter silviterrae TaxID=1539049 RepID=A0A4R8DS50_9BACT|nr:pyrroline-5-carboxylate reductase [Dinghuibacter silviterrae]TDX00658.1 pyrroline-5-carboxylate reductase [Dinghuibacter silviterrae]
MSNKLAIIGGGNLGRAIAEGVVKSGFMPAADIIVTRRNTQLLSDLAAQGVVVMSDNQEAVRQARTVILAVKPYNVRDILRELSPVLSETQHVLISVVTGVWMEELQQAAGKTLPLFRAMPNTAIAIQESMTCLSHTNAGPADVQYVQSLFDTVGRTVTIDEKLMDASTVLGACGIAYALRFIRANIQGGIEIGFDAQTASLIAAQTALGAAELLIRTGRHPEQEIDKVTTPKGCTIAGLNEMEHQGFSSSLIKGIVASYVKILKP